MPAQKPSNAQSDALRGGNAECRSQSRQEQENNDTMARSIECRCDYNFTCGHCLRNAPPWYYTLSDGSAIYSGPLQGCACQKHIEPEEEPG